MNLMMHDVSFNNMSLSNADTLESDWPDGPDDKGVDHPRTFDAVVANEAVICGLTPEKARNIKEFAA